MSLSVRVDDENVDQLFSDLTEASEKILTASDSDFERLKTEPWYKKITDRLTFTDRKGKQVSAQISSLMEAQICVIKMLSMLSGRSAQIFDVLKENSENIEEISRGNIELAKLVDDVHGRIKALESWKLGISQTTDFRSLPDREKPILAAILDSLADVFGETISVEQRRYISWINKHCDIGGMISAKDPVAAFESVDDINHRELIVSSCITYVALSNEGVDSSSANSFIDDLDFGKKKIAAIREKTSEIKNKYGNSKFMPDDFSEDLENVFDIDIDEFSDNEEITSSYGEEKTEPHSGGETLKSEFSSLYELAKSATNGLFHLSMDLMKIESYKYEHGALAFGDESLIEKMAIKVQNNVLEMGRASCLSDLNKIRERAYNLSLDCRSVVSEMNCVLDDKNLPQIKLEVDIGLFDYDLDASADNEEWGSQFEHCNGRITRSLGALETACYDVCGQIEFFEKGDFESSVVTIREKNKAQTEEQWRQEKEAKKTTLITLDGHARRVGIEWNEISDLPFKPENIQEVVTDGQIWILADYEKNIFRSSDGKNWEKVTDPVIAGIDSIQEIAHINGVWVVFNGYREPFVYSHDSYSWNKSTYPKECMGSYEFKATKNLFYANGFWLWRFTHERKYEYTEVGLVWDSKETSSYDESIIYCCPKLDGEWSRWENSPNFGEGVVVDGVNYLQDFDMILSFCDYDYFYKSKKKKVDANPFSEYFSYNKQRWNRCDWEELKSSSDVFFMKLNGEVSCFCGHNNFVSETGYEWKKFDKDIKINNVFSLEKYKILVSVWGDTRLYFCGDDYDFGEIILDEGNWEGISVSSNGILGRYSPSRHETHLMLGKISVS